MIGAENSTPAWVENTTKSIKTYFRGVRSEWGKISWPERRQVIAETAFVIVIVFVFTVAVYLMDKIFMYGTKWFSEALKHILGY